MDNLQFRQPGPSISDQDLAALERELGVRLPDDYREFMLVHNGGRPEPADFPIPGEPVPDSWSTLQFFLSLNGQEYYTDLGWHLDMFRDRVPAELLPIAYDPGGNLVCLGIRGEHRGTVFFWDHELEAEEDKEPDYRNLSFVAESFTAFLQSLSEHSI
jgi:hypothetical protein